MNERKLWPSWMAGLAITTGLSCIFGGMFLLMAYAPNWLATSVFVIAGFGAFVAIFTGAVELDRYSRRRAGKL